MSTLLLTRPLFALSSLPVAPLRDQWARPWDDREQVEYERLVEREISSLRARNRHFPLRSSVTLR